MSKIFSSNVDGLTQVPGGQVPNEMFRFFGIDDSVFAIAVVGWQHVRGEHDIWRIIGEIVELRVWG